jgi:hypothetical protein
MKAMNLVVAAGLLLATFANASAESCVDAFDAIAVPQNFPGRVQSIVWSNTVLSQNSPLRIGNWTVSFPAAANQFPVARMTSAGYFTPLTGPVVKSYVYIGGLTCANAVSGTAACTLVLAKSHEGSSGASQDQDYFELGTPVPAANGDLGPGGVTFIAWTGCPLSISYVH